MTPLYEVLSQVVVRAPLLPAAVFTASGDELDGWCADPSFRFALAVASPDLVATLDRPGGPTPAARAALQRYLIRAATRPTPFGGFAAIGLTHWSDRTDLMISGDRRPTRTRPDLAWLSDLTRRLAQDPALRPHLRVYANTCALLHEGRYYLADPGTGGARTGADVSVRATSVVERALSLARDPVVWDELRRRLAEPFPASSAGQVTTLMETLAEQQFLLPELLPPLTGDPLSAVRTALDRAALHRAAPATPASADWGHQLGEVAARCRAVDEAEPGEAAGSLAHLRALLPAVHPGGTPDVQVDSALPLRGGLNRRLADDAVLAADLLLRLHPDPFADPLAGYRAAFHRRYGDRRVPVLELLDPRFGLGSPADHPGDHPGNHPGKHGGHRHVRDELLIEVAATAIRDGRAEVELTDDLLERLTVALPQPDRAPTSLELSLFVAAASREALDQGDYQLVVGPNLGAQAAGRGLGRFADLLGPQARVLLSEAAAAEAETGAVVAELVYRPLHSRSANVAVRPLVRDFELPIGVAPSLPPDRVLRVDELSVAVTTGRFQLLWDRGDRPVTLTAGHMLNPAAAPPLGRALLDLTNDGTHWFSPFDWGSAAGLPFLPRVRRGRVVLSPARWRLGTTDDVDSWRKQWQVPRLVHLSSGDHRLLLDLDDESHHQQLLTALAAARSPLALQEGLPGPEQAWLPGPRGRHVVELVVPMLRTGPAPSTPRERTGTTTGTTTRTTTRTTTGTTTGTTTWTRAERHRPPGSDWLYITLDGPRRTENPLLTGSLGELLQDLTRRELADGWFFVRYADPDRHLRVRVHGQPEALVEQVLPELTRWAAAAIAAGLRTRLTLESYERELERYGGPETTTICEQIACADSVAVRALLPWLADSPDLSVVSFADLLHSLAGEDVDRQREWARHLSRSAAGGPEFRERKTRLRALIGTGAGLDPAIQQVLAERRRAVDPLASDLRRRADAEGPVAAADLADLASSIVHLHANRLGLDRTAEDCTRGLLDRTLRSLAAFR